MTKNVKITMKNNKENSYNSSNISLNPLRENYQQNQQKKKLIFHKQHKNIHHNASQSVLIEKQKENVERQKIKKKSTKKKTQLSCQSILNFSKKRIGLDTYNSVPHNILSKQKKQHGSSKDVKKCKKKKKIKQTEPFMNNFKVNFSRSNSFIVFSDKDTTMNNTLIQKAKLGLNINSYDYQNHKNLLNLNQYTKISKNNLKNKKHDQNYIELIQNRAATIIQKNWRGYLTRKLLQQYINDFQPQFISQLNALKKSAQISSLGDNSSVNETIKQFDDSMSSIRSRSDIKNHMKDIEKLSIKNDESKHLIIGELEEIQILNQDQIDLDQELDQQKQSLSQQFDSIDSFKRQKPILSNEEFQLSQRQSANQDNQEDNYKIYEKQKKNFKINNESQYNNIQHLNLSERCNLGQNVLVNQDKFSNQSYKFSNRSNQIIQKNKIYDLPRQFKKRQQITANKLNINQKEKQSRISTNYDLKSSNASSKNQNYYLPMTQAENNLKIGNFISNSSRIATYLNDSESQIMIQEKVQATYPNYVCSNFEQKQYLQNQNKRTQRRALKICQNLYTVKILPLPDTQMMKKKQIQQIQQLLRTLFENKKSECVEVMKDLVKRSIINFEQFIKRRDLIAQIVNNGAQFIENVISQISNANNQMIKICFEGQTQDNFDENEGPNSQNEKSPKNQNFQSGQFEVASSPSNRHNYKESIQSEYYTIQLPTQEYTCKKISPIQEDKYQQDQGDQQYQQSNNQFNEGKFQQNQNFNSQNHQLLNEFLYNMIEQYSEFKKIYQNQSNAGYIEQSTKFLCNYLKNISESNIKTIIDRCFIQFTAQMLSQQYDPSEVYQVFKNMVDGSERIVISSLQDEQNEKEEQKIKQIQKLLTKWLQQLEKWQITVIQEMPSGMESSSFLNTQNISLAEIRQSFCYNSKQFQVENQEFDDIDEIDEDEQQFQ